MHTVVNVVGACALAMSFAVLGLFEVLRESRGAAERTLQANVRGGTLLAIGTVVGVVALVATALRVFQVF